MSVVRKAIEVSGRVRSRVQYFAQDRGRDLGLDGMGQEFTLAHGGN